MEVKKHNSNRKLKQKDKNYNDMCRLCMAKNAKVPIFPEKDELKLDKEPPLVCKIMSSVNIQMRKDDGLPSHICCNCASKVQSTYDFLRLCEMSDSFLRQYLDFGLDISWVFRYSELLRVIDRTEEYSSDEQ
uniref:ZAD domain-containing protein n=1 Tax=Cuerna arida TaxID=1464854 RepID=A0A1B6F7Q5_9HEMI